MEVWVVMYEEDVEAVYYTQKQMFEDYPELAQHVKEAYCGKGALYAVKKKIADISDGYMEYLEDRANDWR